MGNTTIMRVIVSERANAQFIDGEIKRITYRGISLCQLAQMGYP